MTEHAHSPIGPSSFERVEACSASAVYALTETQPKSSVYADEGTAAHKIFELCMENVTDPWEYKDETIKVNGVDYYVDAEMVDALTIAVGEARMRLKGLSFDTEKRLTYKDTPLFGTADLVASNKLPVRVLDLKYGAGIQVSADTVQLGLYGLMALIYTHSEDILTTGNDDAVLVETTVLQPRGVGPKALDYNWTRAALRDLRDRADAVIDRLQRKVMHHKYGSHCRFCGAIASCPLLATVAFDAAMSEVITNTAVPLTPDMLDKGMELLAPLNLYIKRITEGAQKYLEAGGSLENAKLVQKRATREWSDEDQIIAWLDKHKIEPFGEPVLLSPAQIEKRLPPSLKTKLADFVTKESSGLTIAPIDDARPAVTMTAAKGKAALMQQEAKAMRARANKTVTSK